MIDQCSCGGTGTVLHYATESALSVSWHMRRPAPNFEEVWLKRVVNNLVSRQKNSFESSGLPTLQLSSELNQQATNDHTSTPRKKEH
ncbi:hypothetical protein AVEN_106337-1 [Araneus ventricosus]|uniref:Uncharacterized protein n=1 Tax=Araneus ventricosus TaxID=182803 RepID=A0A4Y2AU74_ARAVE|nr:hypothetical protein AVEN_106337-1 [Araneus ventricosus]